MAALLLLRQQASQDALAPAAGRRALAQMYAPSHREALAEDAISALFGGVSSDRAYRRQAISEREVTLSHTSRHTELTYGEFDLPFFWELLQAAAPQPNERFVDVGSGCGRLVLASALAYDWEACAGIELLGSLHEVAEQSHSALLRASAGEAVRLSPCEFVCDEAESGLSHLVKRNGSKVVVFIYASCWPSVGPYLTSLSQSLAAILPIGSRVVTVDKQVHPSHRLSFPVALM